MKPLNKMMLSQQPDEDVETEPPGKAVLTRPRVRKAVTLPGEKQPICHQQKPCLPGPAFSLCLRSGMEQLALATEAFLYHLRPDLLRAETDGRGTRQKRKLPLRITPYFAGVLEKGSPTSALRRTMVPDMRELHVAPEERSDPLGEVNQSSLPRQVHRCPDRVLFLTTGFCSACSRYCTRSHLVSEKDMVHAGISRWDEAIEYLRRHPEVRDVLLSEGGPLILLNTRLAAGYRWDMVFNIAE